MTQPAPAPRIVARTPAEPDGPVTALTRTIHPVERLMIAVAEGDVTRANMERYLDAQILGGAVTYCKIFDGSKGGTTMGAEDLIALGVRIRSMHIDNMGPLAVVVPPDKETLLGRLFGMLAVPDRPMRVFNDATRARGWLEKQVDES